MNYNSSMFDWFINSFCKVQFLCYQGEPNWLGIIVLLIPGGMLFLIVCAILILLPGAIKFSIEQKLWSRQEEKKRKKAELEKLSKKQKLFSTLSSIFFVLFYIGILVIVILLFIG